MVNILVENPIKHGMIWGVKTHIFGNIHMMKVFKSVLHLRMSWWIFIRNAKSSLGGGGFVEVASVGPKARYK